MWEEEVEGASADGVGGSGAAAAGPALAVNETTAAAGCFRCCLPEGDGCGEGEREGELGTEEAAAGAF